VESDTIVFSKELHTMKEMLKSENAKKWEMPCKKNMTILLSITFGSWYHFPRVRNPFLANGCLKLNMGSMMYWK
jgi:hypothetical protein